MRLQGRFGVSQRRACRVVGQHRSTQRRLPAARADADAEYGAWLCRFAQSHPRWGWRKAHDVAAREGLVVNPKRTLRLWRAHHLQRPAPRRRKRQRLGDGTAARLRAEHPNHVWALDFQFDETAQRRRLKLLNVIDEFTREALAIWVDHSIDADKVVDVVERIAAGRGAPERLRMDNGPRAHRRRTTRLVPALPHPHRLHRARSTMGERLDRVLQRTPQRRMPQHRGLRQPARSPSRHRGLAQRLQPPPAPPITRRTNTRRLRCQPPTHRPENHNRPTPITPGPTIGSPSSPTRPPADEAPPTTTSTGYGGGCTEPPNASPSRGRTKLRGLLAGGEVRDAWHAKETQRGIYRVGDHELALEALEELSRDLQDETFSPEPDKLGRTLHAWRTQIANWHRTKVTNGPTEAANNLAKLIKRMSFGITNFDHYRTRVLLYAGKPDWSLLDDLTPR